MDTILARIEHLKHMMATTDSSGPLSLRRSLEFQYGQACAQLRKAGLVAPIKAKYRRQQ